jgi:hypothetical protein
LSVNCHWVLAGQGCAIDGMFTVGGTMAGPPLYVGRPETVMSCPCRLAVLGSGLADGLALLAPAPVVPMVAKLPAVADALLGVVCVLGVAPAELVRSVPFDADSRQPGMAPVKATAAMAAAVTVLSATDASRRGLGTLTLQMSAVPPVI